ncbi:MAG: hypothetical protein Q4B27_01660 [Candidatus Saccharibacteria bacterium]|nr:hypothetical protein [Candidatus Saccharibacteria bacterium]
MPLYEVSPVSPCEVTPYEDQLTNALWYRASQRAVELLNMHDLQRADLRWPTPLATLPIALPLRSRMHYDDAIDPVAHVPIAQMSYEELVGYCAPDKIGIVMARGAALLPELVPQAQHDVMRQRLFETMAQSSSPEQWQQADMRNRQQYETGQPLIEQGDMIHAMQPAHVAEALVLGLRCSEVTHRQGLDPVFPLTVSFFAARHTVQPGSDIPLPRNDPYGLVNLILAQPEPGQVHLSREHTQQYQSFVSMATTGVKSIVIRDRSADWTEGEVADAIEHMRHIIPQSGRYIPFYRQSTGQLLLTPEQFDAARG